MKEHHLRRYARNLILPEIGEAGQEKLLAARVLMIGAGGLGSAVLQYLAAAGIGHIAIADGDRVELSNLQRQTLYETGDIGRLKVEAARDRLHEINPDVKVTVYPVYVEDYPHPTSLPLAGEGSGREAPAGEGIEKIISACDVVADGCDNFKTRFLIADVCEKLRRPLISAAVSGFKGQLSTFTPYLGAPHPRYHDLVPELPPEADSCTETGVVGAVCGILGSMQALEVIKEILGLSSLSGTLLRYDGLTQTLIRSKLTCG